MAGFEGIMVAGQRGAIVLFKDRICGRIDERRDGSTVFTYADGWRERIACALPLTSNVHAWPDGPHPFFQHMTAEGWLRERQARAGVLDRDDDLGLLLRYGRDCIGAVSVLPDAGSADAPPPASLAASLMDAETRAATAGQRTVSGVQKKLLVVADGTGYRPAGPDGPAPFIAKFPGGDLGTIVRNEDLTLKLARRLLGQSEITGAQIDVVDDHGVALIVHRFDRTADGGKLRLEDMAQVLGRPRGRENEEKYDASYEEIGAAISKHSAQPRIDLDRYFRLVVVNALLGNCDAHLKNFSLLETPQGLRLSPAYDLVNTVMYWRAGYQTRFALRIDGDYRQHDRVDKGLLGTLGRNLGLPDAAIRNALRDLARRADPVMKDLRDRSDAEPEPGFMTDYAEIVFSAHRRIFGDD